MSALIHACKDGCYHAVAMLTQAGTKLDLQDLYGRSALMYACMEGYYEIASLLVEEGAKLDLQDGNGESVLTGMKYSHHFTVAGIGNANNLSSNCC